MFLSVTSQAVRVRIFSRHGLKTDDLTHVSTAFYMCGTGTVTGLAAMPISQGGLEMWSPLKLVCVQILVACLAGIAPHICCRLILRRTSSLLLVTGGESKGNQQQE